VIPLFRGSTCTSPNLEDSCYRVKIRLHVFIDLGITYRTTVTLCYFACVMVIGSPWPRMRDVPIVAWRCA
jgi:hypothetical protein